MRNWRKLVGVEPTRDTKCRTTGFEDQAQHRPRLASSVILASSPFHASCFGPLFAIRRRREIGT